MLESKWTLDKKHGSGFKLGDKGTLEFFDEIALTQYDRKVLNLLQQKLITTNIDLLNFGMENNFLPKHTKQVLDGLKKTYNIEIISLDGKPALSYYISDEKRLVQIKIK